ncbi:MAG: hypothetical protein AAFX53_02080 [Bacteroidota bacterium]
MFWPWLSHVRFGKRTWGSLLVLGLLYSCSDKAKSRTHFEGAWKIDSTFTFYNGFEQKQKKDIGEWPMYVYGKRIVKEIKSGTYRSYFYEVQEDTLVMTPTQGGAPSFLTILHLERNTMVLKKMKDPLFKGQGQNRFEIRYFSRTQSPKDSLIPFGDPRKGGR